MGAGSCTPGSLSACGMTRMDYQMSGDVSMGLWTVGMAKSATWLLYKQERRDKRPCWQIVESRSGLSLGKRQRGCLLPEWYQLLVCVFTPGKLATWVGSFSEVSAIWSFHWRRRRSLDTLGMMCSQLSGGEKVGIHAAAHSMLHRHKIADHCRPQCGLIYGVIRWLHAPTARWAERSHGCYFKSLASHPFWVVWNPSVEMNFAAG